MADHDYQEIEKMRQPEDHPGKVKDIFDGMNWTPVEHSRDRFLGKVGMGSGLW